MTKEEKKKISNELYKEEEQRWANVVNSYYRPRGAPGRLTEELLEQYHAKKGTGIIHPQDRKRTVVKVDFDGRSYALKHFLSTNSANKYIQRLGEYNIAGEIVDGYGEGIV